MIEHETETLRISGKDIKIDSAMEPLIRELNRIGFKTAWHCSGGRKAQGYLTLDARRFTKIELADNQLTLRFSTIDIEISKFEDAMDAIGRVFGDTNLRDDRKLIELCKLRACAEESIEVIEMEMENGKEKHNVVRRPKYAVTN